MAGLKLAGSFSVQFGEGSFFCFVFKHGFDDCSFQVGWYDTRDQGIVYDVGDCEKKNVEVFMQQFCGNGTKIT